MAEKVDDNSGQGGASAGATQGSGGTGSTGGTGAGQGVKNTPPAQKQEGAKKRWIIRNKGIDTGTYHIGQESHLVPGFSHVIVDVKPSLISAELSIVEYRGK